jgi:hypothetical protein
MGDFIALMDVASELLLGEMASLAAAVQLRCACRAMHSAAEPYAIALGFASTRPDCLGGPSLPLRQWREVWDACAFAVESQGLDASAWGHAIEWVFTSISMGCWELDPTMAAPLIDLAIADSRANHSMPRRNGKENSCTAWILLLAGDVDEYALVQHGEYMGNFLDALVILSDGRFGVVSMTSSFEGVNNDGDEIRTKCSVRVDSDLAVLAPLFEQDRGGRLHLSGPDFGFWLGVSPRAGNLDRACGGWNLMDRRLWRYAADGIAYTRREFVEWYKLTVYALDRWAEAAPCNPPGDHFADLVRKKSAAKHRQR